MAELDGRGKTFGVGAAVAFDDDAVEAEKHAAVRLARVHDFTQLPECRAREEIADAGAERAAHGAFEILADLARGAFGGLERNVAGKAFGDDDVDGAGADVVAFDKAVIFEVGQFLLAQDGGGFAHWLEALGFFDADVEEAYSRTIMAEQDARGGGAHHRQIDEMV